MSLLVTGSIGIDTVKTPFGKSENSLGGSAVYFSMAASFFSPVRLLGVVGPDCPFDLAGVFTGRDIDLTGLEVRKESKTFRWEGSYQGAMNQAKTDHVQLNVLAEAPPPMPPQYEDSKFIFLANTHPDLQQQLLNQLTKPDFVAADTMNCWIQNNTDSLKALLGKIDALILNDDEARLLTDQHNIVTAAEKILAMGPAIVIIKKGEFGSMVLTSDGICFMLPAYPTKNVKDPTGAGDSFAGALMGYLASTGKTNIDSLKTAMAYGTVIASFTIENFSLQGLKAISKEVIDERLEKLKDVTQF